MRAVPERAERLVPAGEVADVQCIEAAKRPRVRVLDRAGRELAAITPDTLSAAGAEATHRMLREALGLPAAP